MPKLRFQPNNSNELILSTKTAVCYDSVGSFPRGSIWWNFYKCNCYVRMIGVSSSASNIQFHSWHTLQVRVCMYIWDCTWARPTMRACIELFILAKEKRERERKRERYSKTTLSFAVLPSSLSLLRCLFYLLNSLFFSYVEEEIPVFHDFPSFLGLFFSFHPRIQVVIRSRSNEWKSHERLDPPQSIRVTLSSKKYPRITRFTRELLSDRIRYVIMPFSNRLKIIYGT